MESLGHSLGTLGGHPDHYCGSGHSRDDIESGDLLVIPKMEFNDA